MVPVTSGSRHLFDANRRNRFLALYRLTGQLQRSAQEAGISPKTVRQHIREDLDFADAVKESYDDYREALEGEAVRRAIMGWEEPVYQQGILAGTVRKYDSRLLELLLKRHIPEFKEKFEHNVNISPGILAVPEDPESKEVWEKQYDSETKIDEGKPGDRADEKDE
jgi:hypothetical protein